MEDVQVLTPMHKGLLGSHNLNEELQKALDIGGWNSNKRPISDFQMRNLLKTTRRDNAAIFSVPGAGKTVESLAYSTIVAGPDVFDAGSM